MINEAIKKFLESKPPQLDFRCLVKFMEDSNIYFVDSWLVSAVGMTTLDAIHLDLNKLMHQTDSMIYFIILHEIGHHKKMMKVGRGETIRKLSSDNFEEFTLNMINEEILADRYASRLFYKFNGVPFPAQLTQQLELKERRVSYRKNTLQYFGVVQNDINKYYELLKNYILS
jgi:hypothetical protein